MSTNDLFGKHNIDYGGRGDSFYTKEVPEVFVPKFEEAPAKERYFQELHGIAEWVD